MEGGSAVFRMISMVLPVLSDLKLPSVIQKITDNAYRQYNTSYWCN